MTFRPGDRVQLNETAFRPYVWGTVLKARVVAEWYSVSFVRVRLDCGQVFDIPPDAIEEEHPEERDAPQEG